ncbi:MAG TPA: hypothetical protein VEG68_11940 [Terriglobales bacterium]|nr:hypothetical protein [Terriglobales bacterium]
MPEANKPDWKEIVRQRLPLPSSAQEAIPEVAAHLEDTYDNALSRGVSEAVAVEVALQEAEDWCVLAQNICRAKSREGLMNHRAKTLWLPGLASLAAANFFMLALTSISLEPQFLTRLDSGLGRSFYWGWLVAQFAFGALGACLSRRAGGNRIARIVAAGFPAIVTFLLCVVVLVSARFEHNSLLFRHPLVFARGILTWVIAPGIALLLGAAPFLNETQLQEA